MKRTIVLLALLISNQCYGEDLVPMLVDCLKKPQEQKPTEVYVPKLPPIDIPITPGVVYTSKPIKRENYIYNFGVIPPNPWYY